MAKRTLENCSLIKQACSLGYGKPSQNDGKCQGYAGKDRDEPTEICKRCKLNETFEEAFEEENTSEEKIKIRFKLHE